MDYFKSFFNSPLCGLILCSTLAFTLSLLMPQPAQAFSGGGSGTSGSPYRIETCGQLEEINDDLDATYVIVDFIDCSGYTDFTPIGISNSFTGSLDGQNYGISHLTINGGEIAGALFSSTNGAIIKKINFDDLTVTGTYNTGALVSGAVNTTLTDIFCTSCNVTSTDGPVGGLAGWFDSGTSLNRSYFNGTVTAATDGYQTGGIAAMVNGSAIANSYSSGTINGKNTYTGGLVGDLIASTITTSYSSATINYGSNQIAGGLAGRIYTGGGITDSFFAGVMQHGSDANSGGIAGENGSTLTRTYYDTYLCTCTDGVGSGGTGGTAVNASNATPNYFINNGTNAPLNHFDFASGSWAYFDTLYPFVVSDGIPSAPSPATSFTASKLGNAVTLTWGAPATSGQGTRVDYRIQYKTSTDTGWTTYSHTASPSLDTAVLTGLTKGKTYSFRIQALNTTTHGAYATLTNGATINGGVVTGLPTGLALKNSSTNADLTSTESDGTITARLVDATTGLTLSTFDIDLSTNRSFSGITGSVDQTGGKSVITGIGAVSGTAATHALYVPKLDGQNRVRICPSATILAQITADCAGGTTYAEGDTNVSVVTIGSQSYWKITGLTGTGGVGLAVAVSTTSTGTTATSSPSSSPATTSSLTTTEAKLADTGSNLWLTLLLSLGLLIFSSLTLIAQHHYAYQPQEN